MKRSLGILISATALCLVAAPAAQAAFIVNPLIDFATDPITVGSAGTGTLSFSIDGDEDADSIERIVLEPSCRLPGEQPPCTNREPGIFSITNATGVTGTSCEGLTFNVNVANTPPFGGSLEFTPTGGLGTIPDMPPSAQCNINFTYTALAVPTFDSQPGEDGIQTDQIALVRAEHNGGGADLFCCGTGDTAVKPKPATPVTPVTPVIPTPTPTPPAATTKKKCKKKKGKKAVVAKCKKKKKG